jgi:hypothetical protein
LTSNQLGEQIYFQQDDAINFDNTEPNPISNKSSTHKLHQNESFIQNESFNDISIGIAANKIASSPRSKYQNLDLDYQLDSLTNPMFENQNPNYTSNNLTQNVIPSQHSQSQLFLNKRKQVIPVKHLTK